MNESKGGFVFCNSRDEQAEATFDGKSSIRKKGVFERYF